MAIEAALLGTLGRSAELKTSTKGDQYVKLNVAVGGGTETQWVNVTCFDQGAITAAADLAKGARVYCEGKLRTSEYLAGDGTKRLGLSLLATFCRPAQIGQARSKRRRAKPTALTNNSQQTAATTQTSAPAVPFDDPLPGWAP